jgi:hypothetical protein
MLPFNKVLAQCSLTDATTCACRTAGQTTCELLPDLTISWVGLESYSNGPSEYSQSHSSQPGRLRVSGSTPNIGYGPLEVRTADVLNRRHFVCGTDTFTVTGGQTNFSCPNGQEPKQIIFQQVYNKQGNNMSRVERMAGSMTYHSAHSHYHVNDWTTMNLCLEDPNEPDPRKWPVVASGAKIGFCLMDFGACSSYPGHCRTSQEYGGGTAMNASSNYPNYGLHGSYGCGTNVQGISVGRTDIYSKSLDMMWINIMDGLCNGNYWIVAEVDPTNVFMEENDDNNWTAIPYAISQQRPAGSGGSAGIIAPQGLVASPGAPVTLTATPGYSYQWSNGATTRSIEVQQAGSYSVTVTAPCGSLVSAPVTVTALPAPAAPTGVGAEVLGPATADLAAVGEGTIVWYDAAQDGQELATGASFTTPVLEESTTYYAASRTTVAGEHTFAAKTNLSGSQNSFNGKQWLIFDAYQPFELVSVKVYATGNGDRHFALVDNVGNLIEERYIYVPNGTHRVDLNMQVPAGTGHRITAFDDNTEIIQQLHRDNSGVSYPYALGTLGAITSSSAGSAFYYFLYDWEVRTPDVVLESSRTPVEAEVTDGVQVDLRMFLQGPYDVQSGLMTDQLRNAGLIPVGEPYTAMGFPQVGGGGGESVDAALFNVTGNDAVVDWVRVELRDAIDPTQVVSSTHGLLTRNGQVRSVVGTALRFAVPDGNYHVAVRHRNHLGCMTAAPLALNASPLVLDFTSADTPAWGSNARNTSGTAQVLWSGNVVHDDKLIYTGANNDRDPILATLGGAAPTNAVAGYLGMDVNMDGLVKYTGANNDRDPILTNVGGTIPTNVRSEQLP